MDVLVIGNPISGTGQTESRLAELVVALERNGHQVDVFLTQGPHDALNCARDVGQGVDRLVVVGGDGTVNDVLNGLPNPSLVPILQMPTGTANMLARELRLPWNPREVADLIDNGDVRTVDMGLAGAHRFILLASAGFDAAVTKEIMKSRGARLGYAGYIRPIFKTLKGFRPIDLRVTVDEERTYTGANVMVLNSRSYGGYFVFSDQARLDSGQFDVCVFTGIRRTDIVRYSVAAFFNWVSRLSDVTHDTCRRVRIDSAEPCPVQADGDYLGSTPVEIELKPASVSVVVPRG